jgi:hypothetical protein
MDYVVKFPKGVVKLLTHITLTHNNLTSNTVGQAYDHRVAGHMPDIQRIMCQDYFRAPNIMDPMRTMVDPYSMANG